jgi:hypothetical protein
MDMRPYSLLAVLAGCLLAGGVTAQSPPEDLPRNATAAQPNTPYRITTDSPEYCGRLVKQLESYQDPPEEVRILLVEGRRMCREGHVIGGVARLRRAVMIMRGDGSPLDVP